MQFIFVKWVVSSHFQMELIFGFTATEDANNQPATVINVSIRL